MASKKRKGIYPEKFCRKKPARTKKREFTPKDVARIFAKCREQGWSCQELYKEITETSPECEDGKEEQCRRARKFAIAAAEVLAGTFLLVVGARTGNLATIGRISGAGIGGASTVETGVVISLKAYRESVAAMRVVEEGLAAAERQLGRAVDIGVREGYIEGATVRIISE